MHRVFYFNSSVLDLHLSFNQLSHLYEVDPPLSSSVAFLHIDNNNIDDTTQLSRIGSLFPNMESLGFIGNPIRTFPQSELDSISASFPRLICMNMSESKISAWEELEKLRSFPSLLDLRVQGIPLWVVS